MEMSTELDELEVFYAPESSFHDESKPEPEIVREGHPLLWEQWEKMENGSKKSVGFSDTVEFFSMGRIGKPGF